MNMSDYTEFLIKHTVYAIKNNGGRLNYTDIHNAIQGITKLPDDELAIFYLEMSVISHNIPIYTNGTARLVPVGNCFRRAITFYNSYKDELELVTKSTSGFVNNLMQNWFYLPSLTFLDPTSHAVFTHGSGKALPDLKDEDGLTYEVKYNYFRPRDDEKSNSPSSLHNADYLIDCTNPGIAVYSVKNNKVEPPIALARYTGILSKRIQNPKACCDSAIMELIYQGTLIAEIETRLTAEGFKWNP